MLKVAEIEAAMAAGTKGPWVGEMDWFDCANDGIEAHVVSPGAKSCFCSFPIDGTKFGTDDETAPWTEEDAAKKRAAEDKARASQELADAKMIAALLNAAPVLIEIAKAAKAMDDEIKAVENGHRPQSEDVFMRLRAAVSEIE